MERIRVGKGIFVRTVAAKKETKAPSVVVYVEGDELVLVVTGRKNLLIGIACLLLAGSIVLYSLIENYSMASLVAVVAFFSMFVLTVVVSLRERETVRIPASTFESVDQSGQYTVTISSAEGFVRFYAPQEGYEALKKWKPIGYHLNSAASKKAP